MIDEGVDGAGRRRGGGLQPRRLGDDERNTRGGNGQVELQTLAELQAGRRGEAAGERAGREHGEGVAERGRIAVEAGDGQRAAEGGLALDGELIELRQTGDLERE